MELPGGRHRGAHGRRLARRRFLFEAQEWSTPAQRFSRWPPPTSTRLSSAAAATIAMSTPPLRGPALTGASHACSPPPSRSRSISAAVGRGARGHHRSPGRDADARIIPARRLPPAIPNRPELHGLARWQEHAIVCLADDPDSVRIPTGTVLALIESPGSTTRSGTSPRPPYPATPVRQMQHQLATTGLSTLAHDPTRRAARRCRCWTRASRRSCWIEWNDTTRPISAKTTHELFEEQAARTPDATAVVFRDRALTYRDLNQRANHLAARLRTTGVAQEAVVGVFADRSLEMIVALLGVLKAGGAYLPLDPAVPAGAAGLDGRRRRRARARARRRIWLRPCPATSPRAEPDLSDTDDRRRGRERRAGGARRRASRPT